MPHEPNEFEPAKKSPAAQRELDPVVRERVQELSWLLVDEQISADEMRLLDNLLLSDDEARRTYIGCMQLHTDLMFHFRAPAVEVGAAATKSPVLGFLNEGLPVPPSEDVKS